MFATEYAIKDIQWAGLYEYWNKSFFFLQVPPEPDQTEPDEPSIMPPSMSACILCDTVIVNLYIADYQAAPLFRLRYSTSWQSVVFDDYIDY